MYHLTLADDQTIIEFHNSWSGMERVYLNGQLVSSKSSILGTSHYFELKNGNEVTRYILTSKVTSDIAVVIDLIKNGEIIKRDVPLVLGSRPAKPETPFKDRGLRFLKMYDLDEAWQEFDKAKGINPKDPEIYFHLACVYSLREEAQEGFICLQKSVENNLVNQEDILTHDMLAFLRIQPTFEEFQKSGFRQFQLPDSDN